MLTEVTMEEVVGEANMRKAYRAVTRNKGAAGIDGVSTVDLREHLKQYWPRLREKLLEGSFTPGVLKGVKIHKPGGGERLLGIPTTQDRVIQQAVQQQLTQLWDPHFSPHSYGYRPGRSAHDAIKAAQGFIQEGKTWMVDIDIVAFFDEVSHDRLMHLVGRTVRDKRLLKYLGKTLRADLILEGKRIKRTKGTPQGGPLSPVLANLYLEALDKELERRELSFCRYADDLVIFVGSERSAQRVLTSITAWIEKHLKLEVSASKSGTGRPWERSFLGYTFDEEGNPQVAQKSLKKYRKKVRQIWSARQTLASQDLLTLWQQSVRGWFQYFRLAHDDFKSLSPWTRRHIRKYFWLRWHSKAGRMKRLRRLGVREPLLKRVSFHAGSWRAARHQAMHIALSVKRMHRFGLWTPEDFALAES